MEKRRQQMAERLTLADGAELIARERSRQVTTERWSAPHDDRHRRSQLSRAAACYLIAARRKSKITAASAKAFGWPWGARFWKPADDPIRNLVKAGALIAAEIDRLQRARGQGNNDGDK
jgi:hypothetical protein